MCIYCNKDFIYVADGFKLFSFLYANYKRAKEIIDCFIFLKI